LTKTRRVIDRMRWWQRLDAYDEIRNIIYDNVALNGEKLETYIIASTRLGKTISMLSVLLERAQKEGWKNYTILYFAPNHRLLSEILRK